MSIALHLIRLISRIGAFAEGYKSTWQNGANVCHVSSKSSGVSVVKIARVVHLVTSWVLLVSVFEP